MKRISALLCLLLCAMGGVWAQNGKPFVISTVQSIWNNEKTYRGYYRYGKDGEWVEGQHEPILK